jgi:lipopolysaccharide transport system ATP-binding protein
MSTTVIKVENLSKQYRIGEREGYKTFREAIVKLTKAKFRKRNGSNPQSAIDSGELGDSHNPQSETIWALKDVSFKVKQGEVVGIIGRNGAGKSTLLKILSKITEPTSGRVELWGRVGSLLEVGTGFHPELTGHENIYLYGAILGMDRWEVTRKFDEIIAFAELEKFADTPVKRYSSGMYTRLAFSVAAHLDSEILLVDEVLAVGDMQFQNKCLGKMGEISKAGRTVLFVSHNMGAISSLCDSALLLDKGKKISEGSTAVTIAKYMKSSGNSAAEWTAPSPSKVIEKMEKVNLKAVRVMDTSGQLRAEFTNKEPIIIELDLYLEEWSPELKVGFDLEGEFGDIIFTSFHNDCINIFTKESLKIGTYCFKAIIPKFLLNSKVYYISPCAGLHKKRWIFRIERAVKFNIDFQINNPDFFVSKRQGIIGPLLEWKIDRPKK